MKWLIVVITLNIPDPWAIPHQKFDSKNDCVEYVHGKKKIMVHLLLRL